MKGLDVVRVIPQFIHSLEMGLKSGGVIEIWCTRSDEIQLFFSIVGFSLYIGIITHKVFKVNCLHNLIYIYIGLKVLGTGYNIDIEETKGVKNESIINPVSYTSFVYDDINICYYNS